MAVLKDPDNTDLKERVERLEELDDQIAESLAYTAFDADTAMLKASDYESEHNETFKIYDVCQAGRDANLFLSRLVGDRLLCPR